VIILASLDSISLALHRPVALIYA